MTQIEQQLLDYVDNHLEELYQDLSKLVQFDTQNFITHGNELECAKYIQQVYTDMGLETEFYFPDDVPGIKEHPAYLAGRGMDSRPNVHGILHGEDDQNRVMLTGHIDTMPVGDINAWTVDPFGGIVKDDRLWGLGCGDNKVGISSPAFAVKALQACGVKLKKTVVLGSCCDEEYGGGVGALGLCLKTPCDTIVNMDGGNYEIWSAALGGSGYEINVKLNYITDTTVKVVDGLYLIQKKLEEFGQRRREELHANPLYTGSDMERSAFRMAEFIAGDNGSRFNEGRLRFVVYTDRSYDELTAELSQLEAEIRQELKALDATTDGFQAFTRFFDYGETAAEPGAANLMQTCATEVSGQPVKQAGACLTDLSVFMQHGSPNSFNFGILRDFSLYGGAHQPDEFIELSQYRNHTKALLLFLVRYCGIA